MDTALAEPWLLPVTMQGKAFDLVTAEDALRSQV